MDAEEFDEIAEEHSVTMVPTFSFLLDGKSIERLEGANPPELAARVETMIKEQASSSSKSNSTSSMDTGANKKARLDKNAPEERLLALINSSRIFLFMKGSPSAPRCGFSRKTCEILHELNVSYGSFDVFSDL